jgi:hypothetical protein
MTRGSILRRRLRAFAAMVNTPAHTLDVHPMMTMVNRRRRGRRLSRRRRLRVHLRIRHSWPCKEHRRDRNQAQKSERGQPSVILRRPWRNAHTATFKRNKRRVDSAHQMISPASSGFQPACTAERMF